MLKYDLQHSNTSPRKQEKQTEQSQVTRTQWWVWAHAEPFSLRFAACEHGEFVLSLLFPESSIAHSLIFVFLNIEMLLAACTPVHQKRVSDSFIDGHATPCGCWESNTGLRKERPVFFTTEPSRQPVFNESAELVLCYTSNYNNLDRKTPMHILHVIIMTNVSP